VDAVLAAGFDDVVDARRRLEALAVVKARPDFLPLAVAFKRVANIREKAGQTGGTAVQRSLLTEAAEVALLDEVERVEAEAAAYRRDRDYGAVLRAVASLKPAVDRFFDEVLVMAEDPAVRANRLGLMKRVSDLFSDVADFRKIQAELPSAAAA
jgi:glycyl-tRNA synthetase beta chain